MFHGLLLIDKEKGVTSHDVVGRLRKILGQREVGHAGTLDPLATGLLIALLGDATKLSQYVMNGAKQYRVGVKFGLQTDSGDITGRTMKEWPVTTLNQAELMEKIKTLVGEITLSVPKYSAVKVAGKKLYDYARQNEEVEVPTKKMIINRAELQEILSSGAVIDLHCEKGTYVRSWVEKLGDLTGWGATVESLRRISSGAFHVDQSHPVEFFDGAEEEKIRRHLVPMAAVLEPWPALKVMGRDFELVKNGQIPRGIGGQLAHFRFGEGVRLLNEKGGLLALVVQDQHKGFRLARVFHH